ncbi:MAG: NAD(P)H-quinone oxidoreductase [Candidatus Puniceispirillum sp.]
MTDIPDMMRIIGNVTPGGPDSLTVMQAPVPTPHDDAVLIKVHAAGVNGADLREREGKYPVPPGAPAIMGLEVSGEIVALGKGCTRFKIGDAVCALLIGGGYAEYAVAPEGQCMPIPDGVSMIDAGGLPEIFCTVWSNMMDRCALTAGESVLVQGGTSGIGYSAIKIAKAFGATVFATARTAEKCAAIRRFGADHAINYSEQDFAEFIDAKTNGRGVDVIIDIIGGAYLPKEVALLAHGGRLMIINLRGGKIAEVDFGHVHSKHLTITGARLRPRSIAEKSSICRSLESQIWPKFKDGSITPETYAVFPFTKAAEAHQVMESSQHIGKVILTPY